MDTKSLARGQRSCRHADLEHVGDVAKRILEDARECPERTYSEHVAAAQEIAAASYREELRRMMKAGTLEPEPEDDELEGI